MTATAALRLPPLPEGVAFLGSEGAGPEEEKLDRNDRIVTVLWARYLVRGVLVDIGWTVDTLARRFREPDLVFAKSAVDRPIEHEERQAALRGTADLTQPGISKSVIMSIPMAHALSILRSRHEQLSFEPLRRGLPQFPTRLTKEMDYLLIVTAYLRLVSAGSEEPIRRLAEWSGESPDTWSARLRRARHKDYLVGRGQDARRGPKLDEFVHAVLVGENYAGELSWLDQT